VAAHTHFAKLEQHLALKKDGDQNFLVGDSFTAPDFHLFEMVDQFDHLCRANPGLLPDFWSDLPHVRAFYTGFAQLP